MSDQLTFNYIHGDPESSGWVVTNPAHGGKVDCAICGQWIYHEEDHTITDGWQYEHAACIRKSASTLCRKIGAEQWSCSPEECICHLHPMHLVSEQALKEKQDADASRSPTSST